MQFHVKNQHFCDRHRMSGGKELAAGNNSLSGCLLGGRREGKNPVSMCAYMLLSLQFHMCLSCAIAPVMAC